MKLSYLEVNTGVELAVAFYINQRNVFYLEKLVMSWKCPKFRFKFKARFVFEVDLGKNGVFWHVTRRLRFMIVKETSY